MEGESITARFIIEILGAPKDFVTKSLRDHIERLKTEGVNVQIEKYAEPVQQDKLFSQFVELDVTFKKLSDLLNFCFDNLPSSVEIMSPEQITLPTADFEQLMNDFQAKLHHTDLSLKTLQAQKQILDKNALNIIRNFIKHACTTKPSTLEELSEIIGMKPKELTGFVEYLVNKNVLKKEGQTYTRNG